MSLIPFANFPTNSYKANASKLSSSGYMTRSTALTGVGGSNKGILSLWVNPIVDTSGFFVWIGTNAATKFYMRSNGSGTFQILGFDINNSNIYLSIGSNTGVLQAGIWQNILASWNGSTGALGVYLNSVDVFSAGSVSAASIGYQGERQAIGSSVNSPANVVNSYVSEVYLNTAEYIDISIQANREKFLKGNKPVYLGDSGELPTGNQPAIYQNNPAATFHINKGYGGNFTQAGTVTASPTSPSD